MADGASPQGAIRVLIADDQPRSRRSLSALLATCRDIVVVGEAADGDEAVRRSGRHRPDVVLTDVRMPGVDGIEATRRIKERWPDIAVIVLTMYGGMETEALRAGADAFLVKGCPPDDLRATIRRLAHREPQCPGTEGQGASA